MEKPAPKEDQFLVKIHAASVNAAVWHMLTADIFLIRLISGGLFSPKNTMLRAELAGVVEAVVCKVKGLIKKADAFDRCSKVKGSSIYIGDLFR